MVEGITIRNTSNYYGSAIYASGGSPSLVNCVLLNNSSTSGIGGTIVNSGADLMVVHCTVIGNLGPGVYGDGGATTVYNSIFWNLPASQFLFENSATLDTSNSIIKGGYAGSGNISVDPRLTRNGTLKASSPAIGSAAVLYTSAKDMHGEARPTATLPDIGADEWLDSDSDNLPDAWEQTTFGNLVQDGTADGDSDGLNDLGEYEFGSDPSVADADGDGVNDGVESGAGSNPYLADTDGDTMPDGYEIAQGLDPADRQDSLDDKDGDRVPNLYEYHRSTDAGTINVLVPDYTVDPLGGGTHTTIGDAILDANGVGDWKVILVKTGTYTESVFLDDKRIVLLGELGGSLPEIVGSSYNAAITLYTGETVVDGFMVRHQNASNTGKGVYVSLYEEGATVRIANTFITSNFNSYYGSGLQIGGGECHLDHCTIFGNGVPTGHSLSEPVEGLAIYVGYDSLLRIRNSIIWNAGLPAGSTQIFGESGSDIDVLNSIVLGGEYGAFGTDPLLTDTGCLLSNSPAINPAGGLTFSIPSLDVHGESRTNPPDIGADEYIDGDADGLPEWWEMLHFGNLSHDGTADGDGDGLTDLGEFLFGSDPALADADGDGANDGAEQAAGTNPHDADSDDDTIPDGYEIAKGLNPADPRDTLEDKDGDRVPNIYEYNRGTDAAVAAALVPDVTVDPAVNPETATVKKTISAAITAANGQAGDWKVILVKKGTYTATASISSKRIALLGERSATPPEIAPTATSTALSIFYRDTVVDGFVIRHQNPLQSRSGIYISLPSEDSRARLVNCVIQDNHDDRGAGIEIYGGEYLVDHCTFFRNGAPKGAGIFNPAAVEGLAIAVYSTAGLRMRNSVVWNTDAPSGSSQIWASPQATVDVSSSIVLGGEYGASGADPLLDRYGYLLPGSPAINASGAGGFSLPSTDIHGESRTSPPDLGVDEFTDSDVDGLADWWEMRFVGSLASNGTANPDVDGLTHLQEYLFGSNPTVADADADGASDSIELTAGTDPWDADTDDDSIPDGYEIAKLLDPLDYRDALEDKDVDRIPNIYEYNRSWDANNAASPAVLTPDVTVDPAVVTETATVKKTIGTALAAAKSAAGDWKIVMVKKGLYPESGLNLNTKRILLMSERVAAPAVISSIANTTTLSISLSGAVVDGMVVRHSSPYDLSGTGIDVSVSGYLGQARLLNSIVMDNAGSVASGVNLSQGELVMDHCTIANNRGNQRDGSGGNSLGVNVAAGAKLRIRNSIVWNPTVTQEVEQIAVGFNSAIELSNSIVLGGEHGGVNVDPQLDRFGNLRPGSPAINPLWGSNLASVPKDLHGENRTNPADLGADEYVDSDADGLPDAWELRFIGNLATTGSADSDSDGLSNAQEYALGSNPGAADTDSDGASDAAEQTAGTDVWATDTDLDQMTDGYEISKGLDPLDYRDALKDKDGDRIPNVFEFVRGTDAAVAGSLSPNYTVHPAGTGTHTTVAAAVTSANGLSAGYGVILVKSGSYVESISLASKPVLLLGEQNSNPPEIVQSSTLTALAITQGNVVIDGFVIRHFSGLGNAYGVSVNLDYAHDQARLVNCIVRDNRSSNGGGISLGLGESTVEYCTIVNNAANNGQGHGVYVSSDSKAFVRNCAIWNPSNIQISSQIYVSSGASLVTSNNLILGGEHGGIDDEPILDSAARVYPASPTQDAGQNTVASPVLRDIQGELRGTSPDIGADEFVDSDVDNLADWWEVKYFSNLTKTATGDNDLPTPDGLTNWLEYVFEFDPTKYDSDGDGLNDRWQAAMSANQAFPYQGALWLVDSDSDGLTDGQEDVLGSNPNLADTNADGLSDSFSLALRIEPTNADTDGDGVLNSAELANGTNPLLADSDGDGVADGLDAFPLDPSRSTSPAGDPMDSTPPQIFLDLPHGAIPL